MGKNIVDREALLHQLQSCEAGLSKKEQIVQSNCFIFLDGYVYTQWEEVQCSHKCDIGIEGAVTAEKLLAILQRLTTPKLDISIKDGYLIIKTKGRSAKIRMEEEVLQKIRDEDPKWKKLPTAWDAAIKAVRDSASTDDESWMMTCIHITPKLVEACDCLNLTRFTLKTGIKTPSLVRATSLNSVIGCGMVQVAESENWIHFRNETDLEISVYRWTVEEADYPDLDGWMEIADTTKLQLPKGIIDASEICELFSKEMGDDNYILVELGKGKITLTGKGMSGQFKEKRDCDYSGDDVSFFVTPPLLRRVTNDMPDCEINGAHLRVKGENFTHVSSLKPVEAS